MKTITFFLLISLYPLFGIGQEFAPTGATWHYTRLYAFTDVEEYTVLESMGDTIIDGITAKHIKVTPPGSCTHVPNDVFMHQTEEKKLYLKLNDEDFYLFHDYVAQPGDSWEFPINYFDSNPTGIDTLVFIVDEVGTVDINGQPRHILECTIHFKGAFQAHTCGTLIEGIGDICNPFPFESPSCDEDYIYGLRCYEDSKVGFYQYDPEYEDCEFLSLSTAEEPMAYDIEVFPNPTISMIYFKRTTVEYLTVEVVSLGGKILQKESGFLSELSLHAIPPGMYMIKFTNVEGQTLIRKIVKQ